MSAAALPESHAQIDVMHAYLARLVAAGGSDLFLVTQAPPSIKVRGHLHALDAPPLPVGAVQGLAQSIMSPAQRQAFDASHEQDLALALDGLGRFRVNVYVQRGETAMVVRHIPSQVPSFEALHLPPIMKTLALLKRGLVLVVGAVGSGKSTSMAAMLDYRNTQTRGHILTVEDPIEFVHDHKQSIVSQREVGIDTHSFDEALRHALREAPDVIAIGEIRDPATLRHALHYAESGHLCISTLHANNANQAIERMLNLCPQEEHQRTLMDMALNLKGVLAQRLVPGIAEAQVPATEVMLLSAYVSDLIHKGRADQLKAVMAKSREVGMHTFDQSLYDLYASGQITLDNALQHADSKNDLALRVRLENGRGVSSAGSAAQES